MVLSDRCSEGKLNDSRGVLEGKGEGGELAGGKGPEAEAAEVPGRVAGEAQRQSEDI